MGCDIHAIAQVNIGEFWVTHIVDELNTDRCYNSFAIMADVRNGEDFKVLYPARGLPKDILESPLFDGDFLQIEDKSLLEEKWRDGNGFWAGEHNFSWLTFKEMLEIRKLAKTKYKDFAFHTFNALLSDLAILAAETGEKPSDVRIVFGFDG